MADPQPPEPQKQARRQAVFGLLVAALVVGGLAYVVPKALDRAAGPDAEVLVALKHFEREGVELKLGFGTLSAAKLSYSRFSVQVEGEHATVKATLDLSGKLLRPDGTATEVSSLGVEEVPFSLKGGDWVADAGPCPTLTAALRALEARRRAIEAGDVSRLWSGAVDSELKGWLEVTGKKLTAKAWYLRSERGALTASEDYRLTGDLPDKPVDLLGTKRLSLEPCGREFCFPHGLM